MNHLCSLTNTSFQISEAEASFCKTQNIPLPQVAPWERLRNMLIFRNRNYLYQSKCSFTGKRILSCIPPEKGRSVAEVDAWLSDEWDASEYARDYDFCRPFFEQFGELYLEVPLPARSVIQTSMENSDYVNGAGETRNSYLVFGAVQVEDSMFSQTLLRTRNVVDCFFATDSELCYECSDITGCYHLKYSTHCTNCSDSTFLWNCHGCKHCFGCANLSQAEYHYYNQPLSREDYEAKLAEHALGSRSVVTTQGEKFAAFTSQFPIKEYFGKSNENSSGDFLYHTENCHDCYFVSNAHDMEHVISVDDASHAYGFAMFGKGAEIIFDSVCCGANAYNLRFCVDCWENVSDLEYCIFCLYGSSHCFGSVGLQRKNYCILNKQYSKNEYFELLSRIKKHMRETGEYGRFFPPALSPFYYNEADVSYFFPEEKGKIQELGYSWKDNQETLLPQSSTLPDNINEVDENVLNQKFVCAESGKKYKIIKPELEFYRKEQIPLPSLAPMQRIRNRADLYQLTPPKKHPCANCSTPINTPYSNSPHPIYCDPCFQQHTFS